MGVLGTHAVRNGVLIAVSQAVLPVENREVQSGFGVYESLRVIGGRAVYLEDHIGRLFHSAKGIELIHPFHPHEVMEWLGDLLRADNVGEATVRILLMGGSDPILYITASKLLSYPEAWYATGVDATTWQGERLFPQYKTCSTLLNYLALRSAQEHGAFEALLTDRFGRVLEGTRSNFFACEGDTIHTACDELVLEGVTRDKIIRAIDVLGYHLSWEAPTLQDLKAGRYTELFISSTSMGALPLASLDGVSCRVDFTHCRSIHTLIREWETHTLH